MKTKMSKESNVKRKDLKKSPMITVYDGRDFVLSFKDVAIPLKKQDVVNLFLTCTAVIKEQELKISKDDIDYVFESLGIM